MDDELDTAIFERDLALREVARLEERNMELHEMYRSEIRKLTQARDGSVPASVPCFNCGFLDSSRV